MNNERILEIAYETVRLTWINDSPEDLIAFAQSVIEAELDEREEYAWPEKVMRQWDHYRRLIANGNRTSAPTDWFESLARPPHARKLTDEEIKTLWVENLITISEEQGYIRFARAIARRINGEEE